MAAGLTLCESNFTDFEEVFEEAVRLARGDRSDLRPIIQLDGDVNLKEIDDQYYSEIENLQPFGQDNPSPIFRFRNMRSGRLTTAGAKHSRGILHDESGNNIPFIAFGRTPDEFPAEPWNIAGAPELNYFNGSYNSQIQILDVQHVL